MPAVDPNRRSEGVFFDECGERSGVDRRYTVERVTELESVDLVMDGDARQPEGVGREGVHPRARRRARVASSEARLRLPFEASLVATLQAESPR